MLGRYERRTWQYDPTLAAPLRYRRACSYDVFIPVPIEELDISVSGSRVAVLSEAEAAIQELNAGRHSALAPLARLLLRTESIASSKVEGLQINARALARAEVSNEIGQRATPTALEVLGNIDAMQLAIENATAEEAVGVEQIVEIHRVLLERAPNSHIAGHIRAEQNWIGGNDFNPCGAAFVPPPPEELDLLLGDLCRFCADDRLPPLIQAAIAHAQFETIHPFQDGNGRTGRALVQVILRRRGLAPEYVPPISVILAGNKEQYISGLKAYREGRVEAWLEVFAVSATRAAHLARLYLQAVEGLQDQWRELLRNSARIRADAAAWKIINVLPGQPVITSPTAVARVERTKPAVNQAIEQLVVAGVLIPVSDGKRNRAWEAAGLLDLLSGLEAGEAPEGELAVGPIPDVSKSEGPVSDKSVGREQTRPLPFTDPIFRLAPGTWLAAPGENPELTLRVAVGMPNVLPLGGSGIELVTQHRGQRREELLIDLLNHSPVTSWLRSQRSIWHWADDAEWTPAGSGSPEFTELWFAPFGIEQSQPTFMARCGFATGVVEGKTEAAVPSIESALDLMLNVRELASDRRPGNTEQRSDGAPAPAALSLGEVADALVELFGIVRVTALAADRLLPSPRPERARVGAWVSVWGGSADRIIDLHAFRQIPRSSGMGQTSGGFEFDPTTQLEISDDFLHQFVADLLYEGLERGGYRDLDEAIDELRGG